MTSWDIFYGPNAGYALDLYDRFRQDPASVDPDTRAFFEQSPPPPDILALLDGSSAIPAESATASSSPLPMREGVPTKTATVSQQPSVSSVAKSASSDRFDIARIVGAARLARGIREYGHLAARTDPLGTPPPGDPMLVPATHGLTEADLQALPASIVWPDAGPDAGSCYDAINRLRGIYCGSLGYDFDHVQDFDERAWLRDAVESGAYTAALSNEERRGLLERLTEVEEFERFLHTTFQGQKRFSIEGCDMLVPMIDDVISDAAEAGAREVLVGMAHRGRLNVLAHILGKPYVKIFSEFHTAPNKELVPSEGSAGINYGWTGDVKYHLGAHNVVQEDNLTQVQVTMAHNPSHLEFVNPVIEGFTRAAQDDRTAPGAPTQDTRRALALTIHGDAAFPGEGVVAETLNLSRLPGYGTGGTVHIIANNQIGFTTGPREGRSTLYAGDLAKGFEIPIIHVNADDPDACLAAVRIAATYRARFGKDFLVDLIGYRRWGHNEGDEPSFTQPLLYAAITDHPTVRALYARRLVEAGIVTEQDVDTMRRDAQTRLKQAQEALAHGEGVENPPPLEESPDLTTFATTVPAETLRAFNDALLARPGPPSASEQAALRAEPGFTPNPKLDRLLQRRRERIEAEGGIEWAHAESLAFAAILADGTPIRMSGQDSERGTFSQRHLVLHDPDTGATYTPLQALPQAHASFAVYNSPLSEAAVLGFEYGYSVHALPPSLESKAGAPLGTLVLWEAQFGDFANAGQVLIDQFIAAARAKWRQHPGLVLLLPHGYEGQGPEHSNGRVERYLQLAAEDNLRVANCTTAAQYFHLLRAQAASLQSAPRPLVIMTPKSLLRHPLAASSLSDLAEGGFSPVLDDAGAASRRERVERLILCSGKVAIDLAVAAKDFEAAREDVAVARVELLYPFPAAQVQHVLSGYPHLREVIWLQEEPRNMGAWSYIAPRLEPLLPAGVPLRYIGRPERASTAEGLAEVHTLEQARILEEAYAGGQPVRTETREESHVG